MSISAQPVFRNTAIFIILIIIGVQWGFYATYTSQFPTFKDATTIIHIHGALLMTWLLLLVIQPMLIHLHKAKLHRTIGKVSYVLGPLIILFIFLVGQGSYGRSAGKAPEQVILAVMALDIRGLFSFAIIWALAMIYRKTPSAHMRYMISTGILGIGPGVGRGLINSLDFSLWTALAITDVLGLLIVGVLLARDLVKGNNYKPFLVVFVILLMGAALWQMRDSGLWQNFARTYAALLYK
jgi:hypothetical protein